MLADVVAPAAFALNGSTLARDLWLYKSARPEAPEAGRVLLALLLVFLHDHGRDVWQRAGVAGPTHACVVPSGRGRPWPHPLHLLASGFLDLPWIRLEPRAAADPWARTLDPGRFQVPSPAAGAAVLLLDDTWASGASAQSAVVALKRAGARSVAVVVLGRHIRLPVGSAHPPPFGSAHPPPFGSPHPARPEGQ